MGQKVNPNGLRLGINKDWEAKWYAGKKDFAKTLKQDVLIREYFEKNMKNAGIAKVEIERKKIALEQEDLNLQRNVYTAYTDALGALKGYESAVAAVESRQGSYDYSKEKYDVGLMNSFDFFQSQSLLTNAQSEVLRTKYDYIFKIKILEFYFGIPISQIMQN